MQTYRGFTLIELLVVVAIVAILAAIALPNSLEAQTRAKVARARADLRTAATALEAYAVDENRYPPDQPRPDLEGFFAAAQLTTPVAYLSSLAAVIDPFRRDLDFVPADADEVYRYWNLSERRTSPLMLPAAENGWLNYGAWVVSSAGPDRVDNYPTSGAHRFESLPYDPTNGTVSSGDILRSAKGGQ